jgi:hypothetical protein
MSAALIAAVFAKPAVACQLPAELLSATASGGSLVLRGVPLEEVVSNRTAAVVHEVLAGLPSLGKIAAAALLATSSVALSIAVIAWQVQVDAITILRKRRLPPRRTVQPIRSPPSRWRRPRAPVLSLQSNAYSAASMRS